MYIYWKDHRSFIYRVSILILIILILFTLHIGFGSHLWLKFSDIFRELLSGSHTGTEPINSIIWRLRLPRAIGCILGGALLGGVGSVFQILFRNPLADPYVLGVSSGSAIGAALALLFGISSAFSGLGILICSIITGMLSLMFVLRLGRREGMLYVPTLLIAGIVMSSLQSAIVTLILLFAGQNLNQVFMWLLGSTTPMFWNRIYIMAVTLLLGTLFLLKEARRLNVLSMGESTAKRLGIDTNRLKIKVLVIATIMTAVVVGSMGILGFIGLVAPYIARRILGIDLRYSFLGSLLIGPFLLLSADLIAQRGFVQTELPVGVVTALFGAPIILTLLHKKDTI